MIIISLDIFLILFINHTGHEKYYLIYWSSNWFHSMHARRLKGVSKELINKVIGWVQININNLYTWHSIIIWLCPILVNNNNNK